MVEDGPDQLASIAALAEPARRALYEYVVSEPEPVSREQAAVAVGTAVHSAKFHLDKLVDQGLLDVEFRRLTGRSGPGAGRPAKLYRRSDRQLSVSLPARRYDLAGEVLAAAVDASVHAGVPVADAVRAEAKRRGTRMATAVVPVERPGSSGLELLASALAPYGYEPRLVEGELRLANCPFHQLACEHTELVCGMNVELVDGILDGLSVEGVRAVLAPHEGYCCVRVRADDSASVRTGRRGVSRPTRGYSPPMTGRDQRDEPPDDTDQDAEPPMTGRDERRPDGTGERAGDRPIHPTEPAEGRDDV